MNEGLEKGGGSPDLSLPLLFHESVRIQHPSFPVFKFKFKFFYCFTLFLEKLINILYKKCRNQRSNDN